MEHEHIFNNLTRGRKLEERSAGGSVTPDRTNADDSRNADTAHKLNYTNENIAELSPKSMLPDDLARHAEPTNTWPGVATSTDPLFWRVDDQMQESREKILERSRTASNFSEKASPTWSTQDNEPEGSPCNQYRDKPNYPIFGHVPPDPQASEYISPHIKALDIQGRAHACHQRIPEYRVLSRQDALKLATAEWLRETNQCRVFRQEHDPCVVCHASPSDLVNTVLEPKLGFSSSLTLQYNDLENYAWSFGHMYVLRERQDWSLHPARLPAEVEATRLLRRERDTDTVPVPEVVAAWKESQVAITITQRARGRMLAEVWDGLGLREREHYARQVGGYVAQWRKLRAPSMQGIDGGPIIKGGRLPGGDDGLPMRFDTVEQYKERLREEMMSNKQDIKKLVEDSLELMPDPEPFTLTHGYLDLDHIFVEDGQVTAIVGWSRAAYLPVWAEYLGLCLYQPQQLEWKKLLMSNIPNCYYGKAPVALLQNYWALRNHDMKALSVVEADDVARECEERCKSVVQERETMAKERVKRRASSARRAKLLEEERQRALEKGTDDLKPIQKEKGEEKKRGAPADTGTADTGTADTGTADTGMADEGVERGRAGDVENLTSSMFFLDVEQERSRAKAAREALQRPLALRPHGGGGSHKRTVSAFPSFSNRNRSPLRYKPQDKNAEARRPSELESPRLGGSSQRLGLEPGAA